MSKKIQEYNFKNIIQIWQTMNSIMNKNFKELLFEQCMIQITDETHLKYKDHNLHGQN